MLKRQEYGYKPPFELIDFFVNVEHRQGRGIFAEAMVKVRVQGEVLHTAAEGNGPVNALDLALRKALGGYYPQIMNFHLSDYKVRILDLDHGTEAITRVLIDLRNTTSRWSTVGAGNEYHRSFMARTRGFAGIWFDGGALEESGVRQLAVACTTAGRCTPE